MDIIYSHEDIKPHRYIIIILYHILYTIYLYYILYHIKMNFHYNIRIIFLHLIIFRDLLEELTWWRVQ